MTFTIYKKSTGEITRVVSTDQSPELQLAEDEDYILGHANDVTQWVKNKQLVIRGEPPTPFHKFDYEAEIWYDPRTQQQQLADAWRPIIQKRNQLLIATDWRVIRAQETGEPELESWKQYRQALRDITQQSDPNNITWPQPPSN